MSPGTEFIQTYRTESLARSLQRRADLATDARLATSVPVGIAISLTEPNWPLTFVDAGVWATDASDGRDAARARELMPDAPRTKASERDPLADKLKFYSGLAGIVLRAARERDVETTLVVGANAAVSGIRDAAMRRDRKLAKSYRFNTDAILPNKWKTRLHAGASIALASPLSRNKLFRRATLGALSAGTIMGILGHAEYRSSLYEHIGD